MTATFVLYPTTTASDIGGYVKAVTSPDDADYDAIAADVATGEITNSDQLISSVVSEE